VPGGHKPVDRSLVDRTVAMVRRALTMVDNASSILEAVGDAAGGAGVGEDYDEHAEAETHKNNTFPGAQGDEYLGGLHEMETKGDILSGPIRITPGVDHILGPLKSTQAADCHSFVLRAVRDAVGSKEDHCVDCGSGRRCQEGESWREWDRGWDGEEEGDGDGEGEGGD
jgi:NAD-dependent dihydropyrimidine dehydrogenase PreA subunit